MKQVKQSINRQYHHFDAQGKIVGRLATEIVRILSGRGRVDFTPHIDAGDFVVVTNTDGLILTGNKAKLKTYHRFSGYPGGISSITFEEQMKKDSRKTLEMAVYGMLPKNKLRDRMMTRLLLIQGAEHTHPIQVEHN